MSWYNTEYRVGLTVAPFLEHVRQLMRTMSGNTTVTTEYLYGLRRAINEARDELFEGHCKLVEEVQPDGFTTSVSVYTGPDKNAAMALARHQEMLDRMMSHMEALMQLQWEYLQDVREYDAANKLGING